MIQPDIVQRSMVELALVTFLVGIPAELSMYSVDACLYSEGSQVGAVSTASTNAMNDESLNWY